MLTPLVQELTPKLTPVTPDSFLEPRPALTVMLKPKGS
jgi:hypothetical protein